MTKIQILTDSCSDLNAELRAKYGIDYVHMKTIVDGKETPASLDWEYYSPKEMYDALRAGKRITTAQVPNEEFEEVFTKYLKQDCDVVYVGCSLSLSGSVNAGKLVAEQLLANFPGREIYCVDSKCSCYGEGALAIRATEYRDAGMSAKEIAVKIAAECNTMNQFATVDSLEYLRKAGRVTGAAAFFGSIFSVKPIIISDAVGNNYAIKKVKGRKNALAECISMLKQIVKEPEKQILYVGHADCLDEALAVKDQIMQEVPFKSAYVNWLGPIIGSTTGPGTIGIYCFGDEVTVQA